MVKYTNRLNVDGKIEDIDLEVRESKSGRTYVRGEIGIDVGASNVVKVRVFQMADKKDKDNNGTMIPDPRFNDIVRLLDEHGNPLEEAFDTDISIQGDFSPNRFYDDQDQLIEFSGLQGKFFNYGRVSRPRAEFKTTILIRSIKEELDRETEAPTGRVLIEGDGLTFFNEFTPLRLVAVEQGADYFLGLQGSLPVLTDVWGDIQSTQLPPRIVESAFGEPQVIESTKTRTQLIIKGASVETHDILDEQEKLEKAAQAQEVSRSEAKEYHEGRKKGTGGGGGGSAFGAASGGGSSTPKAGGFKF